MEEKINIIRERINLLREWKHDYDKKIVESNDENIRYENLYFSKDLESRIHELEMVINILNAGCKEGQAKPRE